MLLQILFLIVGFAILIKGADWLVDGGAALARRYNMSDLAIGLTIIAFGTSMPEFVVNTIAAWNGNSGIVFGNIIGSNNFNIFIILGLAGLISPLLVQSGTVWKEIPISLAAVLMLFFLSNDFHAEKGLLSLTDGIILLVCFVGFLIYVYTQIRKEPQKQKAYAKEFSVLKIIIFIFAGLGMLVSGGRIVVINSVKIAEELGLSQTIIGLTIVAAGTSLPELATSAVAAFKKNNDIAVGNIIGSNIFNIFFVLGASALIRPVIFDVRFNIDMYYTGPGYCTSFYCHVLGAQKKTRQVGSCSTSLVILRIYDMGGKKRVLLSKRIFLYLSFLKNS
jgi:cation:H+ antiporter